MADLKGDDFIKKGFLDEQIKDLDKFQKKTIEAMDAVKQSAKGVTEELENVTGAQKEGQKVIEKSEKQAEQLVKAQENYELSLSETNQELTRLKAAQQQQNQVNKLTEKLNRSAEGSYDALSAQYSLNKIKLNQMSKAERDATKTGKKLEKDTKALHSEMNRLQKNTGKATLQVGDYAGELSNAGGAAGRFGSAIQGVSRQFKAMLANPVVLTIVAIVAAIALLVKSMSRSEKGQDRMNEVMRIAGSILDNVMDVIGELAIFLFDNFPAILEKFGNKFRIMVNDVNSGVLKMRIAWNEFTGDAEEADELTKRLELVTAQTEELTEKNIKLGEQIGKAFEVVTEKAQAFGDEVERDIASAIRLAALEAKFNKDERRALVENAKIAGQSAKLRAEAEELKFINAERAIEALNKSFDLDEKALENTKKLKASRLEILKLESSLAMDDIEAKKGIAQAEADLFNAQTAFDNTRRQRIRRLNSLRMEGLKQARERTKTEIELIKLSAEREIEANDRVIESDTTTEAEKVEAAKRTFTFRKTILEKEADLEHNSLDERKQLKLINDEDYARQRLLIERGLAVDLGKLASDTIEEVKEIQQNSLDDEPFSLVDLLGLKLDDPEKEAIAESVNIILDSLNQVLSARVNAANQAAQIAQKEQENAQANLDEQRRLLAEGEQADVQSAQNRLGAAKAANKKAIKEQEKAQRAQERINTITQVGSLITASANIFRSLSSLGPIGVALAVGTIAAMFGAFVSSKVQAKKAGSKKLGSGGVLSVGGGTHSSGNDTFIGTHGGVDHFAEKGEIQGVISSKSVRRYGSGKVKDVISSLNSGLFEKKYGNVFTSAAQMPDYVMNRSGADSEEMRSFMRSENDRANHNLISTVKRMPQTKFTLDEKGYRREIRRGQTTTRDSELENEW